VSLRELTLEGETDKVAVAVKRLLTLEPPDGYWVGFSGGKDSIVVLDLCEVAGVKHEAHFSQCGGVDPPELTRFIRNEYPYVSFDLPPYSMWHLVRAHKMLPTRLRRYCCQELKERGGEGRLVVTGVRWEESAKRKGRRMVEQCMSTGSTKTFLHPIIDWSSDEVWEYIHERQLPYPSLYDEGRKRVGCVMCPFGTQQADAERWPKIAAQYRRLANEIWDAEKDTKYVFKSGDEYFDWWLTGKGKGNDDQLDLGIYE
jgi:phosphoadenosine phosphosulfate reductase